MLRRCDATLARAACEKRYPAQSSTVSAPKLHTHGSAWSDASATSLQNTIAYAGAPIQSLTTTFSLANYAESTTLKWFVQPSLASPTVWYGPFPQVVNVHS